eukprot:292997-Rhodomonas_salina.1
MPVQRHARAGLQQLAIDGTKNPHVVVATGSRAHHAVVRVDHFQELPDHQRHGLDPLDLRGGG